jgi:predicted acetyltransferase
MEDDKKLILMSLAENEKLLDAIEEEMIDSIDSRKPNLSLNNQELGEQTRAKEIAKEMVSEGLKTIKKLKIKKTVGQDNNCPGK